MEQSPALNILKSGLSLIGLLFFVLRASPAAAGDNLLITEFMAVNNSTLADPNGAYSDWIEIYNAGSNAVNMGGWYLTDNALKLTKWQFPSANLAAFSYLVVFASGTSQTNIGAPLSTSFNLGGAGEYLALVKPDGVTVAWEYAPKFPPQVGDISYGLAMESVTDTLIESWANGTFLVPSGDIDASWTQPGYDDSSWASGPTGFGYDSSGAYFGLIGTDLGSYMQSINSSALFRMPFTVTDPSAFNGLQMRMIYNDGFVAYLNGQEVARRNAPATLSWNSAATAVHGLPVPATPTLQDFDDPGASYSLQTFSGGFTPAVLPADSGSTGNFLRLANTTASVLNTIIFDRTATGVFSSVVATFDFRMTSLGSRADGLGFALLPTSVYGASGAATGLFNGFGEEPNLPGALGVGFDIYQNGGELNNNHVSVHYNGGVLSTPVAIPSFDLANGNFHRAQITISFDGANALVTVQLTPDIYVSPGTAETLFSDFVVPGVSAYEGRVAFGARTGGANANHDLDNIDVRFNPPANLGFEDFNLAPFLGSLQPGANVLAIQGLNIAADDGDFMIVPELVATASTVLTNSPGYFVTPTPGAPNAGAAPGFAPNPQLVTAGGLFFNSVSVEIAISSPAAQIRYTLNGSQPTAASGLYTGPILLSSGSTTVRARGFAPRLLPSDTVSQTYTLLDNDLDGFSSNLPLVIIDTFANSIGQENKIPATMTFIDAFRGRSSLLLPPDLQVRAGIEIRGQSSTGFPKNGYGFETRDEADNARDVSLLGLPAENDWVLDAHYDDKTFMNTFLALELHEKMGHYAVRRRFVEVFLNSSGGNLNYAQDYLGIYVLLEKIKVSKSRVDIAKLTSADNTEPDITGGYMVKKDKTSPGDVLFTTSSGQTLIYHDPKGENLTAAQQNWIVNYINQFERALYAPNWLSATGTNHYSYYIEVGSFVDQHWIVEFTKNIDGYRLSNYLHKDRGGKLFMDPIWDWDLSFGNANYLQGDVTNTWYYPELGDADHIWLRQLVGLPAGTPAGDPDFKQKIADRWGVLRTNILAASNVLARVDEIAALLNEAQARDFQRWPRLGIYVWPNPDTYWPITTYQGTVDWMKRWIGGRFAWIDSQYPLLAPVFNHFGGPVASGFYFAVSAPNPVYFTLDGTDPRLPGGAISPAASLYAAPFWVTNNVRVFARARSAGALWSPPSVVSLVTRTPSLVITEMMYHPQDPPVGSPFQANDFEYLELKNIGTDSLNLRNAALSGGIDFAFSNSVLAAGQQIVVVKNKVAFQARYGTSIALAGEFAGSLNNQGDHLILTGPLGEPILDFSYDNNWYPITDGAGFSLVIRNENAFPDTWGLKSSWRPSGLFGGSPGQNDPAPPAFPTVWINEVLTHPEWPLLDTIELFNASGGNIDIGGWFLTDDFNTPQKFRIPSPAILPAGGFRLFTENEFHVSNGIGIPFALRAQGGQVYLFSADAHTNLTGYVHGFNFGAQRSGVSLGRYVTSVGEEEFVAQSVKTLGSANAGPLVGPVVISEIMYRPPDVLVGANSYDNTEDEYIELRNITGQPVPLSDASYPSNTWKLDQAVHYIFPQGVVIPAGGYLLLVSFDPVRNPSQLAAFQAQYGLAAAATPIFGPYSGKLKNSEESLELKMPDTPASNGDVNYVIVDKVHYDDQTPWPPAADGLGFSLQRIDSAKYGNDPLNWAAAAPGPGLDYSPGTPPTLLGQPQSQTVLAAATVTFSVAATGDGPLFYQWRFQGQNIPGATNASLVLNTVQPANSGAYQAIVLDSTGSAASSYATLTVVLPIRFASPPQSRNVRLSTLTNVLAANITFFASTLSASPLNYQWRFNGTNIPGATNSTYSLSTVSIANHGVFQVLASDGLGSALSEPINLTVLVVPVITQPLPAQTTAVQGDTVTWTVSVSGFPPPLNYSWRRGATVLTNFSLSSTSCTFALFDVQPATNVVCRVVVTNSASIPNATPANSFSLLTVLVDSDGDHVPDVWETQYGFNPNDPGDANADPDGDGMTNLQEYLAGTDPTNALSFLKVDPINLGGAVNLRFGAVSNKTYSVQFKEALTDLDWLNLTNVGLRTTNWTAVVLDPTANRTRYYRLVTPQQ